MKTQSINQNQPVVIKRDGAYVAETTYKNLLAWFHRQHSYSMSHALEHEGYTLHPVNFEVWIGHDKEVVATKPTQRGADMLMQKLANENPTAGWTRREGTKLDAQ